MLSAQQVAAVADPASADPAAEQRLVAKARSASPAELREECARTKAAVADPEQRRQKIHEGRFLRTWTDAEGAWHLPWPTTPRSGR